MFPLWEHWVPSRGIKSSHRGNFGFAGGNDCGIRRVSEVFLSLGAVAVAGAVEAVGADFALRHTDGLDEILELGKLQGGEAETTGYLGDHALVLGRIGLGVLLQIYLVVALEVADDATRNQFQVAL